MTVYLRVFKTPAKSIKLVKVHDHFFKPTRKGEAPPIYQYKLPPEMENMTLAELRTWFMMHMEFGTLPPTNIADAKSKDPVLD